MTVLLGLTLAEVSFLSAETFAHWPSIPETMLLPERLLAEYFAASDPLSRCGSLQRQHRGRESLLIAAGATCAPRLLILDELPALRIISSREVRVTGTRE
jgi:hypothetical protein